MMATTLLGTDVTVSITNGNVYIDNAMVTVADIVADNGVVHVIDAVLPTALIQYMFLIQFTCGLYIIRLSILNSARSYNSFKDK